MCSYVFFSSLRAAISAIGLTVLLNTCFYVLFYFIYRLYCLCSQINDDDDDDDDEFACIPMTANHTNTNIVQVRVAHE